MTTHSVRAHATAGDNAPLGVLALGKRAARVTAIVLLTLVPACASGLARAIVSGKHAGWTHLYRRVADLLMMLGPTFVKAGQVLGTRRDVVPAGLCDALETLQESVTPLSASRSRAELTEVYGDDLTLLFEHIDYDPIACGSIACVYRARSSSGKELALKLRRPGIVRVMRLDLALIRRGATLVGKLPLFRDVPVDDVVSNMCEAVYGQLDFGREADSLVELRENLSVVPRVWIPATYRELSRPRCIVMEYIPGLSVDVPNQCSLAARKRFAASGLAAIYQMLFVDGFVHCDMHPGNLYFTKQAQVVVLDAGFSIQLSDKLRRLFAEFFMNMSIGNGERCAAIVIDSAAGVGEDADLDGFATRMADLVHRTHGLPAKEFSLIAFATEMFELQRDHGIHAAPELIFPLLSLLVIEGTIRDLDPDVDFQGTARPVLMRGLFGTRTR
ncbi:ABC1 kinase family protein [Haloechinothrix salitolerans]|uniref:ABC1 kinase family protein n=1 Tax=Haloechinothrix salitolerans TaxID=926830 RepID=A0ABW2BUS1_9PSEU